MSAWPGNIPHAAIVYGNDNIPAPSIVLTILIIEDILVPVGSIFALIFGIVANSSSCASTLIFGVDDAVDADGFVSASGNDSCE